MQKSPPPECDGALLRDTRLAPMPTCLQLQEDAVGFASQLGEPARWADAGFDRKLKPNSSAVNAAIDSATANDPRKAAGSGGGTPLPLPRFTGGPVASHSTCMLTVTGVPIPLRNWKLSMT
jgi:hypothetical protein